jgi:hypothetical protein
MPPGRPGGLEGSRSIYFDGLSVGNPSYPRVDVVADPNDPRIPGIQNVAQAIQAG